MYACVTRVAQAYVCLCGSKRDLRTGFGQLGPTDKYRSTVHVKNRDDGCQVDNIQEPDSDQKRNRNKHSSCLCQERERGCTTAGDPSESVLEIISSAETSETAKRYGQPDGGHNTHHWDDRLFMQFVVTEFVITNPWHGIHECH